MMKYLKRSCLSALLLVGMAHSLELPQEMILEYSGPLGIPAKLKFMHDHKNYTIDTTIAIPFKNMHFATKGIIDKKQLKPTEYTVYRNKDVYSSTLFDYQQQKITYGKLPERHEAVLPSNTQDLFTVAWQMTLNQGVPLKGTYATDGKKLYPLPNIQKTTGIKLSINNQQQPSNYYKGGEGEHQLEIALATGLHFIPSVIVYYEKGKRYELELRRVTFK